MKTVRYLLIIPGALAAIILIILLWALERVDQTPYFETGYYSRTMERLDSLSNMVKPSAGKVEVGFGRASITPTLGAEKDDPGAGEFQRLPMAGYGNREGAPAEGIHDSVFVKALAIRVRDQLLLLVGSDMLIVPPNISEGVARFAKEKLGIDRGQLFFSATHTHSGVGAWSEGFVGKEFAGACNPAVVTWLTGQFCRAIEQAVEDLQPGAIGSGGFEAQDLISNRLVGERGEKNAEFTCLAATQHSGKRALLGSFGAHATTLGDWNMQISGDYPGFWQRKLETEGIDMAVFFAGSVGSHSYQSRGEGFEKSRYLGESLAERVLGYLDNLETKDSIELSCLTLGLDLPELQIRVSDGLRLTTSLGRRLFPQMGDVHIQAAKIGDLIWVTTPGDFSGELAIGHKHTMQKEGFRALVTSFNGAYTGYIIPGKYYHLDAYESRLMSWFGPSMGPYTDELIRRMTESLVP